MPVANPHIRFTYEDYHSLPEDMGRRYELLDGELYLAPAPTISHQIIILNLELGIAPYVSAHRLGILLHAPVDVVLGQGREREVVQPDLLFVSRARLTILSAHEVRGAPDLVVEVLSPGTAGRDRGYKRHLYGRHGVHEYWVLDPAARTVEVYRADADAYDVPRVYAAALTPQAAPAPRPDLAPELAPASEPAPGPLCTSLLPGLTIDLDGIFRPPF